MLQCETLPQNLDQNISNVKPHILKNTNKLLPCFNLY